MKTLVGINTLTAVEQVAYMSHIHFFYRLGRNHPDWTFAINTPRRASIDRMRNMSARIAIEQNFDYLMFIDDDVIIPVDAFDRLYEVQKDIVAGWTLIRGYPYENMFFKYDLAKVISGNEKLTLVNFNDVKRGSGVIDVDAVGFSCVLIKVDLLRKVSSPWFVTGPYNTEDIYFCIKAKREVPSCTIAVHTDVETAHILGPEVIAPWNREQYMRYYEEVFPELVHNEESKLDPPQPFVHKKDVKKYERYYEEVLREEVCK